MVDHITSMAERPADWWQKPYTEDEGIAVEVGGDSVEPPKLLPVRPKMYNVAVQVNPKDTAKVTHKTPWPEDHPKMYNVGVGVTPKDFEQVIRRPMDYEEKGKQWKEEETRLKKHGKDTKGWKWTAKGREWVGEQESEEEWKGEEFLDKGREAEIHLLERKSSRRADACTMARPAFYKELPLATSMEAIPVDKEVQVTEYDIEKAEAERRGIKLDENNILWPIVKEFDVEHGERRIEDFVRRCWKLSPEWMHHIRLIQIHTTDYRKKYIFEVIFSTPTQEVPVPPATASVFFVFEVGKYVHLEDPIKVSYVLEGTRYPYIPGQIPFDPNWLQGIVADKLRIQRSIDF